MKRTASDQVILGIRRTAWSATLVPACVNCRAPGFYMNEPALIEQWPQCYRPDIPKGSKIPVGPACPQCGWPRPNERPLGEISATMPLWLWKTLLAFKRMLIAARNIKRHLSWT